MASPIGRDRIEFMREPASVLQQSRAFIRSCLQRIYAVFISIINALKWVFCGCCVKTNVVQKFADEIANELAHFNNSGVEGQINGIYITTNETNLAHTRQVFNGHPRPDNQTIHIGCASWHNLDIICARKSTYGLIVDFNPKNAEFMRKTMDMIQSCGSRDHFKRAMIQYLDSLTGRERDLFFHKDQRELPTNRIKRELVREGSWLQSEESYLYIKEELVAKDRLVPITEDIRNSETFARMREVLDRNQIVVDTLYTSNISDFMKTPDEKDAFMESVKQLLSEGSIFIHCALMKQPNGASEIRQKAVLGREVLEGVSDR